MKIYLVGGAVRDQLLGRKITERDFVVVGATPEDLLSKGFRPVGNDFPVFLHPETQEEYALARTERKTGKGYTGFECFADPSVTLEQDLERRDLTINAMAQEWDDAELSSPATSETIIDPFGGQQDLQNKILRHVSPAFAEDPVRILRVARFAARFPDFTVHPETNQLMQNMVAAGEVNALVQERVWKEFSRALTEEDPSRFFTILEACNAMRDLFPEFVKHPESLDYLHRSLTIQNSDRSRELNHQVKMRSPKSVQSALKTRRENLDNSADKQSSINPVALLRFGALTLGLNKFNIRTFCNRLRPPTHFIEITLLVESNIAEFQKLNINNAEAVVDFLERIDAYRRPKRLFTFCNIADLSFKNVENSRKISETLYQSFLATQEIDAEPFIKQGLKGEEIGKAIHLARIEKLKPKHGSSGISEHV